MRRQSTLNQPQNCPTIGVHLLGTGGTYKELSKSNFSKIKIPIPPIQVQKEIVEQIKTKYNSIEHAKEIIRNLERERRYFSQSLRKVKDVEWVELGEVCEKITDGSHFSPPSIPSGFPYITVKDISDDGQINIVGSKKVSKKDYDILAKNGCKPKRGDVLFSKDGTVGKVALVDNDNEFVVLSSIAILTPNSKIIDSSYLRFLLLDGKIAGDALGMMKGMAIRRIILRDLKTLKIPLPQIEIQKQLVAEAEQTEKIITANRLLIELMEGKIIDVLNNI